MGKFLKIVFFLLCVFAIEFIKAQENNRDSLEIRLKLHTINDTVKVNLINELAYTLYSDNPSRTRALAIRAGELSDSLKFLKGKAESLWLIGTSYGKSDQALFSESITKSLKIAEAIHYQSGIAKCYNAFAVLSRFQGNNGKSLECYQKAIKISEGINDKFGIAKYLQNLSVLQSSLGNYEMALEGYLKALKILEALDEKLVMVRCLNNIGSIYETQGNYTLALEYFHKSLVITEATHDQTGSLNNYISISSIYASQADYSLALDQIFKGLKIAEALKNKHKISLCLIKIGDICQQANDPKALAYFQKTLLIAEELSDKPTLLLVYLRMGDYFNKHNNALKALDNYQTALKMAQETNRKPVICELWGKIGAINFKQKDLTNALTFSLKSLALANELKLLNNQKEINLQLSEIYSAKGEYKNAYHYHKLYKDLNDSLFNKKNIRKIAELEFNYKHEKERQIAEVERQKIDAIHTAELKQHKLIQIGLVIVLLLVILLTAFIFRSYRIKAGTNVILKKQNHEIEELNEEYQAINEELTNLNEELISTKGQVEERENLLIQVTDNIPVYISLINNDLQYRFANIGYAGIFNRKKNEIRDKQVKDVLSTESYEKAYPNMIKALTGEVVTFENLIATNSNGQKIVQTTYVPYYQEENIVGLIVCSNDITERRTAETALRKIEEERAMLMANEIERIGQELDSNQKTVTAATLKLVQNSERDSRAIDQLVDIGVYADDTGRKMINALICDFKQRSYHSNWDEFEILFEKVHKSFYEKLNSQFPNLTANERKICAFLKLNMTSKDIAQITFQSEDALKKARLRLRQKFDIPRETNLVVFLQNI